MMAAKKKKLLEKDTGTTLRDAAEKKLAGFPPVSHDLKGHTPEKLVHELQVHQIELEMQAEELKEAKLAMEESRDRFLDLYDFAPVGYLTLNDKAIIEEVNLTGATLLGVERSKLVKTRFSKCILEKDIDEWHLYFVNMQNQEEKRCCTLTLKRGDGSVFPARLESIRVIDSTNGTTTVRVAVSDISDIRGAEEVQKNQYILLHSILESTDSAIFSVDSEYRYTTFNSAHARVMKMLYGADIEPERSMLDYQSVHEDRVLSQLNINRALSGEQFTIEAFSGDETRLRRYFEVTYRPVKDAGNNVTGVAVFAQDITDRKRAEDAMRESKERYRRITEGLTDYLYTVRVNEGKAISTMHGAACAAVTGYTSEEFATDPYLWIRMVFEEDRDRVSRHFSGVMSGNPVLPIEHRIVRKDGQIRWVRDTPILQLNVDGMLGSYDGVIKDITATKQVEEALQKNTDELRTAFVKLTASEEELRRTIDDLGRSEQALRESEAQLRAILDATPFPIALVDLLDNNIDFWSRSALTLFGHTAPTAPEWYQIAYPDPDYRRGVVERWKPYLEKARHSAHPVNTGEYRVTCRDGSVRICELYAAFLADRLVVTFNDVTGRTQADTFRQLSADVLGILNEPAELKDAVRRVLNAIKLATNADAVGIRLKTDEDFPYFVENGFSNDFLLKENTLVARDQNGGICRDSEGNVSLECTCGLVISGKTDPENPLFTPGGSSWTNNSFPFLKLPEKDDPRFHPRNTCIHEGYASVALIPIRKSPQQIIGILQVNAFRKDCFTPDIIQSLELIAGHLGEALMRKQAEAAVQESELRYRTLVENIPQKIFTKDRNFRYISVNEKFAQDLGIRPEDMVGKTDADLFPANFTKKYVEGDIRVMETGQTEEFDEQYLLEGKETWVHTVKTPLRDTDGKIAEVLGVFWDITERKQAEKALQHLTEFQDSIITNALVWLSVLDPAGKILVWNTAAAEISGYRSGEVLGKNEIWKLLYPKKEYRKQVTSTINRIIGEKKYLENFETVIRTREGNEKVISWNTKGIPDTTGKIADYIVIGMDVTDRHRAEEQLNKTVDELKRFNNLTVDRELRMIALKKEINALQKSMGKPEKYRIET